MKMGANPERERDKLRMKMSGLTDSSTTAEKEYKGRNEGIIALFYIMLFFIHVDIMNMHVYVYLDISIRIKVIFVPSLKKPHCEKCKYCVRMSFL